MSINITLPFALGPIWKEPEDMERNLRLA